MHSDLLDKLCLGTAQFGLNYGINNKTGKISEKKAFAILNLATKYGVDRIDTAYDYGESEKVLGRFIRSSKKSLKIISKVSACRHKKLKEIFNISLERFGLSGIYGYLIHSFKDYEKDVLLWDEVEKLRAEGRVEKVGFSLYVPSELEVLLKRNLSIDIIQAPFSIFDQRFKSYFSELRKRKIEFYARSVFLQGLVFLKPLRLSGKLSKAGPFLERLHNLALENGIPLNCLCLDYVLLDPNVDMVLIGVDDLGQIKKNIEALNFLEEVKGIYDELNALGIKDEDIILPYKWEKS